MMADAAVGKGRSGLVAAQERFQRGAFINPNYNQKIAFALVMLASDTLYR